MMYVAFPNLTNEERLAGLPNLDLKLVQFSPADLVRSVEGLELKNAKLTSIVERPAYVVETAQGKTLSVFADTGDIADRVTAESALAAAEAFYRHSLNARSDDSFDVSMVSASVTQATVLFDQWTVSNSLNPHRPFYKVQFDNSEGLHLYVSTATGQVVRDTTSHERFWNWLGANLHWIYPVQLRRYPSIWHWVVVVLSTIGVLSVLTGATIGLMRLRLKRRYRDGDMTPYKGVNKLHHVVGMVSAVFLVTFITSGLLSMNPLGVFNAEGDCLVSETDYSGKFEGNQLAFDLAELRQMTGTAEGLKEVRFYQVVGEAHPIGIDQTGRRMLREPSSRLSALVERATGDAAAVCDERIEVVGQSLLTEFDAYYYSHHGSKRPLPVFKLELDDLDRTWVYVDAQTGEWIFSKTATQRVQRWVYNGLHSLDFLFLIERRPLWDIVVISLCVIGSVMALSSVVLAYRRLQKRRKRDLSRNATGRLVQGSG